MSDPEPRSLAVVCDDANRVQSVLHDPDGLAAQPGVPLVELFDHGSREKALRLLQAVRDRQAAFGWELHVRSRGQALVMRFVGARVPAGVLVAGAESQGYANALFGRLVQDGAAAVPRESAASLRSGLELYEQLAALNNQLLAMQRELEKKNAELTRLLADRAQLAAMAAHDLRTPLQVIAVNATLLETALPGAAPQSLEMIRRNAERMQSLVDELLFSYSSDIGRLGVSLAPLELEPVARAAAQNHRALAQQKGIALEFAAGDAIPRVLGDAQRLDQALNNLLHNAVKFSPPGSTIRLTLQAAGGDVLLSIQDQGTGLEPDQLEALLHGAPGRSHPGTLAEPGFGLGIAIVRVIVEKHRGVLEGESRPGAGVKFTIRLPAHRE